MAWISLQDEQYSSIEELNRLDRLAKREPLTEETAIALVRVLVSEQHRTQKMLAEANDSLSLILNKEPWAQRQCRNW